MDPNAAGPYGDVIADDNQQIFVGPQSRSKASLQSLLPEKLCFRAISSARKQQSKIRSSKRPPTLYRQL
jgi:hypothetical protein